MYNRTYSVLFDDYNLSGVNECIHVLENGVHSDYQYLINEIPEFDKTEERWELYNAPKGWETITKDYRGFWNYVKETNSFKSMVWIKDTANSQQVEHLTAMADNDKEFKQDEVFTTTSIDHGLNQNVRGGMRNMLNGKSNVFIFWHYFDKDSSGNNVYRRYLWLLKYNKDTNTVEPFVHSLSDARGYTQLPANQELLATPWFFSNSEFTVLLDKDNEVIPHKSASDTTNAVSVSEREGFAMIIHRAAKPLRILYDTRTKKYVSFNSLAVDMGGYPVFTNTDETVAVLHSNTNRLDVVDINAGSHNVVTPNVALPLPGINTKCTLSPDGTMMAWTDQSGSNPRLRIVRLRDGQVIYTSSRNIAATNAIWTNANSIIVSATNGYLSRYTYSGDANRLFVQEINDYDRIPNSATYMGHYLEGIGKVLFVKYSATNGTPVYFIADENTGRIEHTAANSNYVGLKTSLGGQSCIHRVPGHDNWFLIPTTASSYTILLKYNKDTQLWSETILASGTASKPNDQYAYYQPLFFDNGTICVWFQNGRANNSNVAILDLTSGNTLTTLSSQVFGVVRKLDETHFAYNGESFTALYEVDKTDRAIIEKVRQNDSGRSVFVGFND